jgi:hypothetical protein
MVTSAPLNHRDVTPRASRHALDVTAREPEPRRPRGRSPTRHRGVRPRGRFRRAFVRGRRVVVVFVAADALFPGRADALFLVVFPGVSARASTRARGDTRVGGVKRLLLVRIARAGGATPSVEARAAPME